MKTHFSNDSSFFLFLNGWEKLVKTFLHIVMQEVTNNNRKKEFLLYCRLFQLQWKYVVFMCRIFVHYLSKIFVFAGTCNCILFPQKYNYFQNDDLIRKKKFLRLLSAMLAQPLRLPKNTSSWSQDSNASFYWACTIQDKSFEVLERIL